MRKALLYIFFLVLLVSNSVKSYAFALPHEAIEKTVSQVQQDSIVADDISESKGISHTELVFNDFDVYDEYDNDNHETTVKEKSVAATTPYLLHKQLVLHFIAHPFCDTLYNNVNISRLPRYDYISLKVLRI